VKVEDFRDIEFFTPGEVVRTGAALDDVSANLIIHYDRFRRVLNRRVVFAPNGLTTGVHSSPLHPRGLAGDCHYVEMDGPIDARTIFEAALLSGFHGIGIYWNGIAYSTHLDLRDEFAFWIGHKKHRETAWEYHSLINDPKNFS
jgi:hypothetical protein